MGTTMPSAPMSRMALMMTGSFQGTRTMPAAPAARQAIRWFWMSLRSMALCSPSIQMKSKPQPAIISVTKGLSKPTWEPSAIFPAATLSVILQALYMRIPPYINH